jgi:hypothetical protein
LLKLKQFSPLGLQPTARGPHAVPQLALCASQLFLEMCVINVINETLARDKENFRVRQTL